jgi:hypothetical protein
MFKVSVPFLSGFAVAAPPKIIKLCRRFPQLVAGISNVIHQQFDLERFAHRESICHVFIKCKIKLTNRVIVEVVKFIAVTRW